MNPERNEILIVDDEEDLRDAIAFDFRRKGYCVFAAENGVHALEVLEANPGIRIVLSDIRMPQMNGIELLRRIKEKSAFLPVVIFLSGFSDTSLEEAYDLGAEAVFPKPFDRQNLFDAVSRALLSQQDRFSRKEIRVVTDLPLEIRFLSTGVSIKAKATNIGRGGMFVELSSALPALGERVDFCLETSLPTLPKISGEGIVRWFRSGEEKGELSGSGIEFVNLDHECIFKVISFINFLKTKAFIPRR